MRKAVISFLDTRINNNIINDIAILLEHDQFIFVTHQRNEETRSKILNKELISIPELPHLENINKYPTSKMIEIFSPFKETIIKLILRFHPSKSMIYKNQIYHLDSIYYNYLYYFETLNESFNIVDALFGERPHLPLEYLFHIYVEKKIVRGYYQNYLVQLGRFRNQYFVTESYSSYTQNQLNYMTSLSNLSISELEKSLEFPFNDVYQGKLQPLIFFAGRTKSSFGTVKDLLTRISTRKNIFFALLTFPKNRLFNLINKFINRSILDNNKSYRTLDVIENYNYVFFPLHFQPEATTLPHGGIYENQLIVVNHLLSMLRNDQLLVVKEHPAYYSYTKSESIKDYRNNNFYRFLNSHPKIIFLNHNTDSNKLIKGSSFVATVTGTVALEALYENKICVLYGESIYSQLPNVIVKKNITDEILTELLNNGINISEKTYRKELLIYLNMLQKFSYKYSLPRTYYNRKNLVNDDLNLNLLAKVIVDIVNSRV
jgi:hypothetical protein